MKKKLLKVTHTISFVTGTTQAFIFFSLPCYKTIVMADLSNNIKELNLKGEAVKVAPAEAPSAASQNVTPWEVEGAVVDGIQQAIDYNKLIEQFGTRPIDDALLERFEKLTGRKPHIFLRRGTFFSHR